MNTRASRSQFLNHWLDITVDGVPIGEWCKQLKNERGKAQCIYCNVAIKYDNIGVRTIKDHAASKRHKDNRAVALGKHTTAPSLTESKLQEASVASTALHNGRNCTVNLSPVTVDVLTKAVREQIHKSIFASLLQPWVKPETKNEFIEVYVCFYCAEEFSSKLALQDHHSSCDMKPPELQAVRPSIQYRHDSSPLPPLICHSVVGDTVTLTPTKESRKQPYTHPPKERFISALGLLPKKKAAQVCKQRRNTECEGIDLDEDIPLSPTMPRTPKLLISHLSREGSENGSSGISSSISRRRRSLFSPLQIKTEKDVDETNSDNESDDEKEKSETKPTMSHIKSLYNIDLASPLGQFVSKHIKGDPNLHVLSDVESHCLTSTPKKSPTALRLRERRIVYPLTFKGIIGKSTRHVHQYKFSRKQRKEFMNRVNTGLDKNSRMLFRSLKPCRVKLTHLTKAVMKRWMPSQNEITVNLEPLKEHEIAYWTSPKPATKTNSPTVFPKGLNFSSPNVSNVLGLRTRQDVAFFNRSRLSIYNYVSEETFAEVTENRRAVYKSLLSDFSSSESGSSETENSPSLSAKPTMPILRRMLSTANSVNASKISTLPDITNLNVHRNMNGSVKYGLLSPISSLVDCSVDKSNDKYGLKSFLSVSDSVIASSNTSSLPGNVASKPNSALTSSDSTRKKVSFMTRTGPKRFGRHNVEVRIAQEGDEIKVLQTKHVVKTCSDQDVPQHHNIVNGNGSIASKPFEKSISIKNDSSLKTFDCVNEPPLRSINEGPSAKRARLEKEVTPVKAPPKFVTISSSSGKSKFYVEESDPNFTGKVDLPFSSSSDETTRNAVRNLFRDFIGPREQLEKVQSALKKTNEDSPTSDWEEEIGNRTECEKMTRKILRSRRSKTLVDERKNQLAKASEIRKLPHFERRLSAAGLMKRGELENPIEDRVTKLLSIDIPCGQTSPFSPQEQMEDNEWQDSPTTSTSTESSELRIVEQTISNSQPNTPKGEKSLQRGLEVRSHSMPHSPQLRKSSLRKTVSISQKAEERKSFLSSFLLRQKNNSNYAKSVTKLAEANSTLSATSTKSGTLTPVKGLSIKPVSPDAKFSREKVRQSSLKGTVNR